MTEETKLNIGDLIEKKMPYITSISPNPYIFYVVASIMVRYDSIFNEPSFRLYRLLNLSTGNVIERSESFLSKRFNGGSWKVYK